MILGPKWAYTLGPLVRLLIRSLIGPSDLGFLTLKLGFGFSNQAANFHSHLAVDSFRV